MRLLIHNVLDNERGVLMIEAVTTKELYKPASEHGGLLTLTTLMFRPPSIEPFMYSRASWAASGRSNSMKAKPKGW